jgi:pimeloyl-ACP methyl ester carboxylesterase
MDLVFVHGWSVRSTATYGELPARLEKELGLTTQHIFLGKYISFDDSVTMDDLALALDAALIDMGLEEFACVTHSTGGPLLRHWYLKYPGNRARLKKLIMLAPANHGSALAQLGKSRLSRIKAFFEGVEPGQRILDWLELGSEEQWALNMQWLDLDRPSQRLETCAQGLEAYVLAGNAIDPKLYDHLNSYTGESGGDGVVRVAAANLNYEFVRLEQSASGELLPTSRRRSPATPLFVLPASHSGGRMGIMTGVEAEGEHPSVQAIAEIWKLRNETHGDQYWPHFSVPEMRKFAGSMVVFRVLDDRGELLSGYDLYLTAGPDASPDALPQGFFIDRQRNSRHPGKLTYFLDHSKIAGVPIGFRIEARPDRGLAYYKPAYIAPQDLKAIIQPHETLMIEIVLRREVDRACFKLTHNRGPEKFGRQPSGQTIPKAA